MEFHQSPSMGLSDTDPPPMDLKHTMVAIRAMTSQAIATVSASTEPGMAEHQHVTGTRMMTELEKQNLKLDSQWTNFDNWNMDNQFTNYKK